MKGMMGKVAVVEVEKMAVETQMGNLVRRLEQMVTVWQDPV